MSSTPETPFPLTRWTHFTPAFQTNNSDASLGDTGIAKGTWYLVGRNLVMYCDWIPGGSGISPGTGTLMVPFPPGFTSADVDVARLPIVEESEGTIEGMLPALCYAILDGTKRGIPARISLATTDGVIISNECLIEGIADLTDGDLIFVRIELPLKEPALPG